MDMLKAMTVSLEVANRGGFSSAGRVLGLSPPSVTRIISELEAELGVPLFRRSTRSVDTTEAGERFLVAARQTVDGVQAARAAAREDAETPRGVLRVTAPVLFGQMHVLPIVQAFLDLYPDVRADLTLTDRQTALIEEGQDVAVRIGHLQDSSLKAVRVAQVRWTVCTAPSYFETAPRPALPQDLKDHRTIGFLGRGPEIRWRFRDDCEVVLSPHMRCSTMSGCIAAARSGWGLTRALSYQVDPLIGDGQLVQVLAEYEKAPLPVSLLHSEGGVANTRTRRFTEFFRARIANVAL